MDIWDIQPYDDWFKRFIYGIPFFSRTGSTGERWINTPSRFDQMRRQMEKVFQEQFTDIETKVPKELIREYQTPEGIKVREVGPLVYGYSMTIGPDGKPKVNEFGNLRSSPSQLRATGTMAEPLISNEREPLADVVTYDKEVKVVVELPGVNKESIKINVYDNSLEVTTNDPNKKYHRVIEFPQEADIETVKSTYKNGILEIVFKKKELPKPKGKGIKIE